MSIIDRLRDPYRDEWLHNDDKVTMLEAADELERLYAAMAKGPVGYAFKRRGFVEGVSRRLPLYDDLEYIHPLYFIHAPELKP